MENVLLTCVYNECVMINGGVWCISHFNGFLYRTDRA